MEKTKENRINTRELAKKVSENMRECKGLTRGLTLALGLCYFSVFGTVPVFATAGMEFFNSGVDIMQMVLVAIGAVILIMGIINFLEAYANDNPGSKSQGQKQFVAGAGIIIVSLLLIPELKTLITL